jgi:multimeric flavodoxin WrbA
MKVIAINGSQRPLGNCSNIINEMQDMFEREGVEFEIVHIYDYSFMNCNACYTCEIRGDGRCYDEDDGFNQLIDRLRAADALLMVAPSYAGACPSVMQTFMERAALVFEKSDMGLRGKVGGAVAVAAHDGGEMVYNQLVHFMLRNGMMVCGSNPVTVFRCLSSPQYSEDTMAMRGIQDLMSNMVRVLMRLNGYE